jgi:hypothetical protein
MLLVHTVLRQRCLHHFSTFDFSMAFLMNTASLLTWSDFCLFPERPRGGTSRALTALGRCPDVIHQAVRRRQTLHLHKDIIFPTRILPQYRKVAGSNTTSDGGGILKFKIVIFFLAP